MSLCAMSMNISMIYPFGLVDLGQGAFSQLVMFDMGHAVMAWDAHDRGACKYGGTPMTYPCCCAVRWRPRAVDSFFYRTRT